MLETRQHSDTNIVIILVGNKGASSSSLGDRLFCSIVSFPLYLSPISLVVDLEHLRVVSTEEGKQFAEAHDLLFVETSAKTAQNVNKARRFVCLLRYLVLIAPRNESTSVS